MSECPKPGIYPGVPFAEYAAWDAINSSFLHRLATRTPFHAKRDRENPKPETDALRIGRALHSYTLEPATFAECWAVWPKMDKRTKAGKEAWELFEASLGGRGWVTDAEFEQIAAMANEVRRQQCVNLICAGRAEVSIVWQDKATGVMCKRRLDYERSDGWNHFIADLKSSDDISPREFSKDIANYGYAMAAAFSIDGWKTLTGEDSIYSLLAIEKGYNVAKVWEPGEDTIAAGRDDYRQALTLTAKCLKSGEWPAYGTDAELIEAPDWYLRLHGVGPY